MIRRAAYAAILLLLVAALLPGVAAAQPVGPNIDEVYLQSLGYSGSGCPQGKVGTSYSSDRLSFTLIFDAYVASVGQNVPASEGTKDCTITLTLHLPAGWEMATVALDMRGYAQLPAGRTGEQTIGASYPTNVSWRLPTLSFAGPLSRDYLNRQTFLQTSIYSECNGTQQVTIKTQNSIARQGQGSGQLTIDSIDGKITQIGGVTWQRCSAP